jgi:oligoribonuclease NrnB/cAMP/cGMP phosphodiesterase (DHH superfamily)
MKCFYHNDMDGHASGAIVYKFFQRDRSFTKEMGEECEFIEINYNKPFPLEKIAPNESVVIVDFSLQKDGEFEKLLKITDKVIWIDHHKTAIEKHGHLQIRGIRQDGVAACELTWKWFYPDKPVPKVIQLLGDYDIWAFKFGNDTNYLQTGIRLNVTKPESSNWETWLKEDYYPYCEINNGTIAIKYRDNYYKSLVNSIGFYTEFEGYRGICCNASSVSSQLFDSINKNTFDIMLPFSFDGNQWTVSIYSTNPDIDCSEIAKKYGGGGHKGAAGFQCKELPFKKLTEESK